MWRIRRAGRHAAGDQFGHLVHGVEGLVLDPIGLQVQWGLPRITEGTLDLFRSEYRLPFLAPEIAAALPVLKTGGVLFTSTNAADWQPENFLEQVEAPLRDARKRIIQRHYVPQPPDFPISRSEPAYLKTVWLRIR